VFSFKPDAVGTIYQDNILSIFDTARLLCGGRVLESISNVSEIMPTIFYGSTPAEAVNSALGELMGCDKYRMDKFAWVQSGDGTGNTGQDATLQPVKKGTSTVPGFDVGTSNFVVENNSQSASFVNKNSSSLLTTYGHTMTSGLTKKYFCSKENLAVDSGFVTGIHTQERFFAVPLWSLFGTFSISPQFLPLRNMGVLSIELTLSTSRGAMNIYPKSSASDDTTMSSLITTNTNPDDLAKLTSGKAGYTISNVYVYGDVVQPNPSIVEKCDQLVQSSTGISMIFSTWSTSSFNFNYSTTQQLQVSRSYSHVQDICAVFRPVDAVSSCYARGDQTYLGSRVRSYRSTIGSSSFPAVEIDNTAVSLLEVLKSFGHHTGTSSSVFNLQNYTGSTGITHVSSAYTGLLENLNTIRAGGSNALYQATSSHTAPPSNYCIAQNYARLLGEGRVHALSGISTRLSGSILTLNLQLYDVKNTDGGSDKDSTLNTGSVDCILGNSPLNCVIAVHSEQLLRIADSSIMVSD
jgi:hypothetical protein